MLALLLRNGIHFSSLRRNMTVRIESFTASLVNCRRFYHESIFLSCVLSIQSVCQSWRSNHTSRKLQKHAPCAETQRTTPTIDIVPLQFMVIYPARDLINNSAPVTGSQSRFVARGPKQSQPRVDDSINYDKRATATLVY